VSEKTIVVAGHICLDIIPEMSGGGAIFPGGGLLAPGSLTECGSATVATGGAVSNTGLALHRLGLPVRLVGKVGDDLFGRGILAVLGRHDKKLAAGMSVARGATTSYSLVVSPPGADRAFVHCPGANADFRAADVPDRALGGAALLHFGYPTLMRRMYERNGAESARLLLRAKRMGLTTSLDMTLPDPASESGRVNWRSYLTRVLPAVDVFLPSIEEILFMLERPAYERLRRRARDGNILPLVDGALLRKVAAGLFRLGAAVVVLKLGDRGLYLRTTADWPRLVAMGECAPRDPAGWLDRECAVPCFVVKVVGTNGSGDCAIAGFLAGLARGLPAAASARMAVAVGACNVEAPDAWSGVRPWNAVLRRIKSGWRQRPATIRL
jgi:sugar/nucleoside kinase (ribokinase family)